MKPMVNGLSDCAKGVNSGRWAAARESVEFGRGGRQASRVVCQDRMLWRLWPRGRSGAKGADGRRGQEGATAQRTLTPDDEQWRGRASSSAAAGGAEINFMV
jgi:hypothetical protein